MVELFRVLELQAIPAKNTQKKYVRQEGVPQKKGEEIRKINRKTESRGTHVMFTECFMPMKL